jgi:hypothetical protein
MRLRDRLKDLFIPCTENGFKPNVLERISVAVMLVLILITFAGANLQALLWINSDWLVSSILPGVIVDLTNKERDSEALGTLRRNDLLDQAATLKAEDMATNEYFAHYSPAGVSPWFWFDKVSYGFVHAGENLAVHFTDSSDVIDAWMESPLHRANIMNNTFTEIGVGTARGEYKGQSTIYVVQLFGTPSARVDSVQPVVAGTQNTSPITLETQVFSEETQIAVAQPTVAPVSIETVEAVPAEELPIEPIIESVVEPVVEAPMVLAQAEPVSTSNEITMQESGDVVLYSDLATTARPGVPAVTNEILDNETGEQTGVLARTATQPKLWLQFVYGVLAIFVVIALIMSVVIEWRRQNPTQIAYACALLLVMGLLFHIHALLTTGLAIV